MHLYCAQCTKNEPNGTGSLEVEERDPILSHIIICVPEDRSH
jgi:hypothetical protein